MNLPNIHRIELPEGGVRKPTLAEVADGLCSVQQMKGRVARTYVLSHGDGDLYHIDGGTVNEGWFAVLDQVIEVAEQLGVYVIIPFVNTFWCAAPRNSARNSAAAQFRRALLRRPLRHRLPRYEHWGTTAYYAQWSGQDPSKSIDFFHDETQQVGLAQFWRNSAQLSDVNSIFSRRPSSAASSPPCWSARIRARAGSTRTSRRSSRGRRGTSSST